MPQEPNDFKQDFNLRYPSSKRDMRSTRERLNKVQSTRREATKLLKTTETVKQCLPPIFSNWALSDRACLVSNIKVIIDGYELLRTKDINKIEDLFPRVLSSLTIILDICKAQWVLRSDLKEYIISESSKSLEKNLRKLETNIKNDEYPIKSVFFDKTLHFAELTEHRQSQEISKILYRLIMTSKSILWINHDRSISTDDTVSNNQVFINWMFHKEDSCASLSQLLGLLQQNNDQIKKYVKPRSDIIPNQEKAEWAALIIKYPAVFQALSQLTYESKTEKVLLSQKYIFIILRLYNNTVNNIQNHLVFDQETQMFSVKAESKDTDPKILLQVQKDLKGFNLKLERPKDGSQIIKKPSILADMLYDITTTSYTDLYLNQEGQIDYALPLNIRKAITTSITAILKMQAQDLLTKE